MDLHGSTYMYIFFRGKATVLHPWLAEPRNVDPWTESERVNEVAQLCPTLCDPMDCNPSGSSIHGIF